jgi:hypothetical protein
VTRWQEGHASQGEERVAVGEAGRAVCEGIKGLGRGGVACLLDFLHVGLFFLVSSSLVAVARGAPREGMRFDPEELGRWM